VGVPRLLEERTDPSDPIVAFVYAGPNKFTEMMQLIHNVREVRPKTVIVVLSCGCLTEKQESVVLLGMTEGMIAHAVDCGCGGYRLTRAIHDAVKKNWTPADADVQISPLSPESSVDLGA
jgi:hypothetical protein